jgi:hypothetical protein
MLILALILALQENGLPQEEEPLPPGSYTFGIGPDFGFWSTRFTGSIRKDGDMVEGTTIDLRHDLDLSPSKGIPIYGGGTITIPTSISGREITTLFLSAEYWNAEWVGSTPLAERESFGNRVFPKGTSVESHFSLTSLDLAIGIRKEDARTFARAGGTLLLHVDDGKLRMKGGGVESDEHVGTLTWGVGVFGEFHPFGPILAGASVKGYMGSSESLDAWGLDLRAYGGFEWKFFRVESGIRYARHAETPGDESLRYDLYGLYVSLSLVLRL